MSDISKYKKLATNSAVFAIANFGGSILRFIIVPFYTYYLTRSEYGTVDMITTTVSLILPLFSLAINEGTLRYALKKDIDNSKVMVSSIFVLLVSSTVFAFSYLICEMLRVPYDLWTYFYVLLIIQGIYNIILNYTRGIGKTVVYAIAGITNTIILVLTNVFLIAYLRLGILGYMLSLIFSFFIPMVFLFYKTKNTFRIRLSEIDFTLLKQMMKYSIPLIPTAMMWWIINASDRYVITWFLGISATGMYAVAHKIPSIINMLYSIFQQAWQISAVEEGDAEGRENFYSDIYSIFCCMLFIAASLIIGVEKYVISIVVANEYIEAWKYVPFLVIGAVFSSFAGFLGINYTVAEKTFPFLITSAVSAVVNLILSILLTPIFGMQGTSVSTVIGFALLWFIRSIDTQKYIKFNQNYIKIILQIIILLVQSLLLILEIPCNGLIQGVLAGCIFLINYRDIGRLLRLFMRKI